MKELLYFSASDLMIQVNYKPEDNSIYYSSHRKLTFGERVVVEQYLLTNVAVKTEYYKKHPAVLNYLGINGKLVKDLNQFHLKNTIKSLKEKEATVDAAVKELIDQAMANYYFEQIGAKLLEIRKQSAKGAGSKVCQRLKQELHELIDAYNLHSAQKVSVRDVVPGDLAALIE